MGPVPTAGFWVSKVQPHSCTGSCGSTAARGLVQPCSGGISAVPISCSWPEKIGGGGPCTWVSVTHVGDELLALGFALAQPWLLQPSEK